MEQILNENDFNYSDTLDSKQIIFECKNVNLSYSDHQVLKNINLSIRKNSVMAFIGPSGCGKSTFLRCLNRLNDLIPNCKITGEIRRKRLINSSEEYEES